MRRLCLFALIAVLLSLSSCGKSEYWVKGLTLPPGSTVTTKSETTKLEGPAAMMPMMGEIDKTLMVGFECKGGWSAVSSHIDSCMKAQGYVDTMSGMASLAAAMPTGGKDFLDGMKYYTKSGEKYAVMLNDMGGMMSKFSQGKMNSMPGMGTFEMTVMKFK